MTDFFISYNRADKQWAEWIAWQLEEAGYSTAIQAWDFRPGNNFVMEMHKAATESNQTIAVLSESYLKSSFTQSEWAAAFASDPQSLERKLLPVRVKECKLTGILAPLVYVDLVGLDESVAKQTFLMALAKRGKPKQSPNFPKNGVTNSPAEVISVPQKFPSMVSRVQKVKAAALQQQLDRLIEDYNAVNNQLGFTINAIDQQRLQRQRTTIAEEMDKIAVDLDTLGA
jgi:TIR domain/Effector-associated domain 9